MIKTQKNVNLYIKNVITYLPFDPSIEYIQELEKCVSKIKLNLVFITGTYVYFEFSDLVLHIAE